MLLATILGSSMAFIDGTVVNVALPALQADLRVAVADLQWVVEAYALFLAALVLVGGALGDRYGRRRIYVAGVAVFAVASAWCGLASDAGQLIVARSLQGIGAALLVPGSLAIIGAYFDESQRGQAIGTWSGFTAITATLGPVTGGWLVEHISWRATFFINLPIALMVIVVALWRVPESRAGSERGGLDWRGALTATLGLGAIIYGLLESSNLGLTHPVIVASLVAGVVLLGLFVVLETRLAAPMMPFSLFRSRTFSGANLLTLLLYAALGGATFFLPLNLIQVQGYSPTEAGAALLPFILIMSLLSRWSGGLVDRYGARVPLTVGSSISAAGLTLAALPGVGGSYWTTFFPAMVVMGLGMAIAVAPLTTTVMTAVDARYVGVASGINNAVARVGGLLAVAVFGVVVLSVFSQSLDQRLDRLQVSSVVRASIHAQEVRLAGIEVTGSVDPATAAQVKTIIDEAFVDGFRVVMLAASGMALASSICAGLMIEDKAIFTES